MPPSLEPAFILRGDFSKANLSDIKTVNGGPQRMVLPFQRGSLKGKGVDAKLVPGGGETLLINPDTHACHLDGRLSFRTADDQTFYVQWSGVLMMDAKCVGPLGWKNGAKSTAFGEHQWFSTPPIETSDEEFEWCESSVFVGEGRWVCEGGETGVEYQIYWVRASGR